MGCLVKYILNSVGQKAINASTLILIHSLCFPLSTVFYLYLDISLNIWLMPVDDYISSHPSDCMLEDRAQYSVWPDGFNCCFGGRRSVLYEDYKWPRSSIFLWQ